MSVLLETPPLKGFSGSLQPYFRFEASPARRRLVPEVPEVPESLFMPYFLSRSQISSARAWNCQPRAVRAKAVRECHIACSLHASRGAHAPALAWTLGAIAGFWGGAPAPRRNFVFETPAQRFVCLRSKTCPSVSRYQAIITRENTGGARASGTVATPPNRTGSGGAICIAPKLRVRSLPRSVRLSPVRTNSSTRARVSHNIAAPLGMSQSINALGYCERRHPPLTSEFALHPHILP